MPTATTAGADVVHPCVVIGGGMSGLCAAAYLQAHGVAHPLVLEASDRVGGRLRSSAHGSDAGGAFVGPTQNRILRLAQSLGVATQRVRFDGTNVLTLCGERSTSTGSIPSMALLPLLDVNHLLCETDRLAATISPEDPLASPSSRQLDALSVAQWLEREAQTREGRAFYTTLVQTLCCVEPAEISMLGCLTDIASAGPGGFMRILETDNAAQERTFVGGAHQICTKLAERIEAAGARILRDHQVSAVDVSDAHVAVTCANGSVFRCAQLIVAVPPPMCSSIQFTPPLPAARLRVPEYMKMGRVVKIIVHYRSAFWRENGRNYSGAILSDEGPISSSFALEPTPVSTKESDSAITSDIKASASSTYKLVGFCVADNATKYGTLSVEDRRVAVLAQYARAFQCNDARSAAVAYEEQDWSAMPHVGGGYCGVAAPGFFSATGDTLHAPLVHGESGRPRVHWASAETATRWMGYMDGAVQAGERAAHEALAEIAQWADKDEALAPLRAVESLSKLPPFMTDEAVPSDCDCVARPIGPSALERALPRPNTAKRMLVGAGALVAAVLMPKLARRLWLW